MTRRSTVFFDDPMIDAVARGVVLAGAALLWVVLLVRIVGLRSFSKMTSFDFVMTVAMGSLVGSASRVTEFAAFAQVLAAMIALFLVQWVIARSRQASDKVGDVVQNRPMLLMRDGQIIDEALRRTRVARTDLMAKLREANVLSISEVRAVVLETTGDISVLHGDRLEPILLEGVERVQEP